MKEVIGCRPCPVAYVQPRKLYVIAAEIRCSWGSKISPYAMPYLTAMLGLTSIKDDYYADTAETIVSYFLANATGWRGEDARRIKAELRGMLNAN